MAVFEKGIRLTEAQSSRLRALAAERQTTEEALLDVALNRLIEDSEPASRTRIEAWERERIFIDQRMKLGPVSGVRTWTREELYDR